MSNDLQYARLMRSFQAEPDNPSHAIRGASHVSRLGNAMPDVDKAIESAAQARFNKMPKPSCPPCAPQRVCPPPPPRRTCPPPRACPAPPPCPVQTCPVCPTALQGVQGYVSQNKYIAVPAVIGGVALLLYFMGRSGI